MKHTPLTLKEYAMTAIVVLFATGATIASGTGLFMFINFCLK